MSGPMNEKRDKSSARSHYKALMFLHSTNEDELEGRRKRKIKMTARRRLYEDIEKVRTKIRIDLMNNIVLASHRAVCFFGLPTSQSQFGEEMAHFIRLGFS